MKLHEIIQEQDLQEGPILNKIGTAVGQGVGALAKGVGAVAGGIAGLGAAAKKGFQAGKKTVAGAGDEPGDTDSGTTAPAASGQNQTTAAASTGGTGSTQTTSPTATGGTGTQTKPSTPPKSNTAFGRLAQAASGQDLDAPEADAAEKPADTAAGQNQTQAEKPAADGAAVQAEPQAPVQAEPKVQQPAANDNEFQKFQQNISKLAPEQQKDLMAALMSDPEVKAKIQPPAADAEVKPAVTPDATQQTVAKPGRQRDAKGRFIGKNAPRTEPPPSQAEIDADREAKMGPTSDSIIRTGNALSEDLASHVKTVQAMHRGFQRGLANPFAGPNTKDDAASADRAVSSDIVDKTGTMPVELINRVNNLDSAGKQQLFKFLKGKTMKLNDLLKESEDLEKLADEIAAQGPQVLKFFLEALKKFSV